MSLKRIDNFNDEAFFAEYSRRVESMVVYNLSAIGEACINIGRSTDSYTDQTGNLRNSIGYVVVCDGQVVEQATTHENRKQGGKDGTPAGEDFIKELVGKCRKGIYLIVVAGMSYATYVSAKGNDVLDSAELEADKLMRQLGFKKR